LTVPVYDGAFYDRAEKSAAAARRIVSIIAAALEVGSVLDVGCARGTWLAAWRDAGCRDVFGIDGPYVDRDQILIDPACFMTADLAAPFSLGRRFDLAQCLEVAEHLPASRSLSLVADLTAHSDAVLFSAAPPGQGGAGHINEQPYAFWQKLFAQRGYVACDVLRPALRTDRTIPYWYRYNIVLYLHADLARRVEACRSSIVPAGLVVPDISPLSFRIRKFLLRALPPFMIDFLAFVLARWGQGRTSCSEEKKANRP